MERCRVTELSLESRIYPPLVAASLLTLITAPAFAFRTGSDLAELKTADRVRFTTDRVPFEITEQVPESVSLADTERTVRSAFATWTAPACTGLAFEYGGISRATAVSGDGRNTVEWVLDGWLARGFSSDQAAVTDVQYARREGEGWRIAEADIYLNGEHHAWNLEGPGASGERDVLSVVTHEVGHLLGLLHVCEPNGLESVPFCSANPSANRETMHPLYHPAQATLQDDDVAGLCFLYPSAECAGGDCPEPKAPCTGTDCPVECGGVTCAPDELCLGERCVAADGSASCIADADCPTFLRCVEGACEPGSQELGDVCLKDSDCASSLCSGEGYCALGCGVDAECGAGEYCLESSAGLACVGDRRPMGAVCASGSDCTGDECLSGAGPDPICTRRCGPERAACPAGWECGTVEGAEVCAPEGDPMLRPTGGCQLGGPSGSSRRSDSRAIGLLLLLGTLWMTRKASGTSRIRRGARA